MLSDGDTAAEKNTVVALLRVIRHALAWRLAVVIRPVRAWGDHTAHAHDAWLIALHAWVGRVGSHVGELGGIKIVDHTVGLLRDSAGVRGGGVSTLSGVLLRLSRCVVGSGGYCRCARRRIVRRGCNVGGCVALTVIVTLLLIRLLGIEWLLAVYVRLEGGGVDGPLGNLREGSPGGVLGLERVLANVGLRGVTVGDVNGHLLMEGLLESRRALRKRRWLDLRHGDALLRAWLVHRDGDSLVLSHVWSGADLILLVHLDSDRLLETRRHHHVGRAKDIYRHIGSGTRRQSNNRSGRVDRGSADNGASRREHHVSVLAER